MAVLQVNVVPRKTPRKALLPTAAKHAPEKQSYKFDHVLGQEATQADLCSAVDIPQKVASCVAGYAPNHSVVTAGGTASTHYLVHQMPQSIISFTMQEPMPMLRVWTNRVWEDPHHPGPTCDGTGP